MYHTKTVSSRTVPPPPHDSLTSSTVHDDNEEQHEYVTEGVIYLIPPHLTEQCLNELDFREKGGYARDIVTVIEDDDTQHLQHQALLYRGTVDNPAIWIRSLLDLNYSAGTYVFYVIFICRDILFSMSS